MKTDEKGYEGEMKYRARLNDVKRGVRLQMEEGKQKEEGVQRDEEDEQYNRHSR